jgi:hypothetical protein
MEEHVDLHILIYFILKGFEEHENSMALKIFTFLICVSHLDLNQFYHVPVHSDRSQLDGDEVVLSVPEI